MSLKSNLLNLFSQDVEYNYHLISTTEPNGSLIYLIKNGLELNTDSLEFSKLKIAEELVELCSIKIEKFAPSIYFTEEIDIDNLKDKLNKKFVEDINFNLFIESIKDEYRTLEVRDSLLYKKDPDAYEAVKKAEYLDNQKELWGKYEKQIEDQAKSKESILLAYDNDLIKLLKEYFESIIEFEKRDFNFSSEITKVVNSLINKENYIKINDTPYSGSIEVLSLSKDRINVYLTNNNDYSFTATLRFQDTKLETENIVRIGVNDTIPITMTDYDFLILLYDIDTTIIKDWNFKNETDRFNYTIDYLAPIFKEEKKKKQEDFIKSLKEDNNDNIVSEDAEILDESKDIDIIEVFNNPIESLNNTNESKNIDDDKYESIM